MSVMNNQLTILRKRQFSFKAPTQPKKVTTKTTAAIAINIAAGSVKNSM